MWNLELKKIKSNMKFILVIASVVTILSITEARPQQTADDNQQEAPSEPEQQPEPEENVNEVPALAQDRTDKPHLKQSRPPHHQPGQHQLQNENPSHGRPYGPPQGPPRGSSGRRPHPPHHRPHPHPHPEQQPKPETQPEEQPSPETQPEEQPNLEPQPEQQPTPELQPEEETNQDDSETGKSEPGLLDGNDDAILNDSGNGNILIN